MYSNEAQAPTPPRRRRRSCLGCFLTLLTVLVVLLILVGVGWIFVGRPYLHNIAENQLDNAMNNAVEQIPSQVALLPGGQTVPIQDTALTNLIVLNLAPSSPVKNPDFTITTQHVRLDFQLYGYPDAITFTPTVSNGHLVAQNVQVDGAFGLIMSPDEMTALLNKHFADAQSKLQKTVNSVQLKDHEMDVTLG
jgi:hypothetical protein